MTRGCTGDGAGRQDRAGMCARRPAVGRTGGRAEQRQPTEAESFKLPGWSFTPSMASA